METCDARVGNEDKIKLAREIEMRSNAIAEKKLQAQYAQDQRDPSNREGRVFQALHPFSAVDQCSQAAPWHMDTNEAKQRGFRNGVYITQQAELLRTLKGCLETMQALNGVYPPTRSDTLAITHLEDCIIRFEKAHRQLEKDLGYNP